MESQNDFRIIELLKETAPEHFKRADTFARKEIDKILLDAPKNRFENFIYLLLVNYYTFRLFEDLKTETEKNSEEKIYDNHNHA